MHPFFLYFGGKWKLARRLGAPRHPHVIEPFGGSCGYSVYWSPPQVAIIERDPIIFGVWDYLIRTPEREVLALPIVDCIDELPAGTCQEGRDLVGFWLNRATSEPAKRRSSWARHPDTRYMFWGPQIRWRIASQLKHIRHWTIRHGDYRQAPDIEAHWHIDPPYVAAGRHYRFGYVGRRALADWCKQRKGFVQVCGASGEDYLPFRRFAALHSHNSARGFSPEAICEFGQ